MKRWQVCLHWPALNSAINCKALNDLALWLYIYREEGWGDGAAVMGLIAAVSNLPGSQWNTSFAFTSANYYIGGVFRVIMLVASVQHHGVNNSCTCSIATYKRCIVQLLPAELTSLQLNQQPCSGCIPLHEALTYLSAKTICLKVRLSLRSPSLCSEGKMIMKPHRMCMNLRAVC